MTQERTTPMKRILTTLAALALVATTAVPAMAGMIDDIRSRGVVKIVVHTLRRKLGAPEIIESGRTGFFFDTVDEGVAAVHQIATLDRRACREASATFAVLLLAAGRARRSARRGGSRRHSRNCRRRR